MYRRLIGLMAILIALLIVPAVNAQDAEATPEAMPETAPETAVQFIELTGPAAERDAEISSLTWAGDTLLLITENPFIYAEDGEAGRFYALSRESIEDYLAADDPAPLEPYPVPLMGPDIRNTVGGFAVSFDGFEAAAVTDVSFFTDDLIFLTIEADTVNPADETMRSYVVSGMIQYARDNVRGIRLNLQDFVEIPRQTDFNNMAYESILMYEGRLVALYEANTSEVNPDAVAYEIDLTTGELSTTPLENIPYRITDTTSIDENGVFWAINYFFPGEQFLNVEVDPIFEEYGIGESHTEFDSVERLVPYQYTDEGITFADIEPIQLLMTEDSNGRNWEGIARWDSDEMPGFLVVTDRFPVTLLGFVPLP
jgi:hypothetical protein